MDLQDIKRDYKRNASLFLFSQIVSMFGSSLVQYALMWHITLKTQSGLMMTLFIVSGFLPNFLLSPFAGVWADRYNRKRLIVIADASIAVATLILAIVYMAGNESIAFIFLVAAIRAIGSSIHGPAVNAVIPQLVPEDKLTRINGINGSLQSAVMLASPMISAALIDLVELSSILFIDVVTAFIGISILLVFVLVPDHDKVKAGVTSKYFDEMKEGFRYIKGHTYLVEFFMFSFFFFFLISPMAFLTPLQTVRSYGEEVWRLSALEITFSLGMMIGGGIMATWGGFANKTKTMVLSIVLIAIGTFMMGLKPHFYVYLSLMTLMGMTLPIYSTPAMVILQSKVEEAYMGRVFSVMAMIQTSMMPLGMIIFGPMADFIAIEYILVFTGLLMGFMSMLLLRSRVLILAGE
jgi:MFS transporter, DHA3 family, macrolide efflux protein